jgi:uncharacterized repeat protein (TIGR03803 family)
MKRRFSRPGISASTFALALFVLTASSWAANAEKVIYNFTTPSNGLYPGSKLLFSSGRLYGTTQQGGTGSCFNGGGCGVVFALSSNSGGTWTYHKLYAFQDGVDAQSPVGNLVLDAAGNLYGAAEFGGANGFGAVYKLTPNAGGKWTESVIYSFGNTPDGSSPTAGLTSDAAGNLYGTTNQGGTANWGTVYKLTPNSDGSWSESVLHSFAGSPDGIGPAAGVILDAAGSLYGTTEVGGSSNIFGSGTVFELSPSSGGEWSESILYTFPNVSVGYPVAPVYLDGAGNLYGSGKSDGAEGSAYELISGSGGSWTESTLFAFHGGYLGGAPYGSLAPGANGSLYGTTLYGGGSRGVIYELTPGSNGQWTESVVHVFGAGTDGQYCEAGLTAGKAGTFYGSTANGGVKNWGTVFEFIP